MGGLASVIVRAAIVVGVLLVTRPWRLPRGIRLWGGASILNASVFVVLPVLPATSPWRPLVSWIAYGSVGISILAVVAGLFMRRYSAVELKRPLWATLLFAAALPALLMLLIWGMWGLIARF